MADIATVFHWSAESMEAMTIEEIIDWRERAIKRSGASEA
jgi:hypothetical protein